MIREPVVTSRPAASGASVAVVRDSGNARSWSVVTTPGLAVIRPPTAIRLRHHTTALQSCHEREQWRGGEWRLENGISGGATVEEDGRRQETPAKGASERRSWRREVSME